MRSSVTRLSRALVHGAVKISGDEQDAVNALAFHLLRRLEQDEFEPFEDDGGIFLTISHMQRLLRGVGARCTGEKAAAQAIRWLCSSGILEDTREVKRPRRRQNRMAAREKFGQGEGSERGEGGRDAQPSLEHSYWWRVFRVVPLSAVLRVYGALQGAYARFSEVPQALASLSAWAKSQGLISRRRGRLGARPGSVQHTFRYSGPP